MFIRRAFLGVAAILGLIAGYLAWTGGDVYFSVANVTMRGWAFVPQVSPGCPPKSAGLIIPAANAFPGDSGGFPCPSASSVPQWVNNICKTTSYISSNTVACTMTNPVGSGHMVACWTKENATAAVSSVTDDKGNTQTLVDNANNDGSLFQSSYRLNITNGPQTFTATFASAVGVQGISCDEFSGVATTLALDVHAMTPQSAVGTGANAISSASVTTTAAGELIVAATFDVGNGSATISAGTAFTLRQNDTSGGVHSATESLVQSAAGSVAGTFTGASADDWVIGVMTFKHL